MRQSWMDVTKRQINTTRTTTAIGEDGKPVKTIKKITKPSREWYGRRCVEGVWKWTRLFTDKRASQMKWTRIIRNDELRAAGIITPQMEQMQRPISEHIAEYKTDLKRRCSDDHYRIAVAMLDRFVALAKWESLADVDEVSAVRAIGIFSAQGKLVSYTNQYLTRVKAFLNWCVPLRLTVNPLQKLKRGNLKKAKRKRARRPLAEWEITALLRSCGDDRRLKYAIPIFTGLRRKELSQVIWEDLHLDSVIPYIHLRPEITKTGEGADIPLHPNLMDELRKLPQAMPTTLLFKTLPEGATMLRDLKRAGIVQTDARGRRADYHALRHTFAKRLDETGCSHATRKALLRHSGDQTDDYTLARQRELYEAILRLPTPGESEAQQAIQTGTGSLDIYWTKPVPDNSGHGEDSGRVAGAGNTGISGQIQTSDSDCPQVSSIVLSEYRNRDSIAKSGLRSSVGYNTSQNSLEKQSDSKSAVHKLDSQNGRAEIAEIENEWPTLSTRTRATILKLVRAKRPRGII